MSQAFIYPSETPSTTKTQISALNNAVKKNFITDYGGNGNGTFDNFNALKQVLADSATQAIDLYVPNGEYYLKGSGNLEVWPLKSKGLRIKGDGGAIFFPENNRLTQKHEFYFMRLQMATVNSGVEVKGVTIDGSRNPQDLYFTMNHPSDISNTVMCKGFMITSAQEILFHEMNFQHMYGGYCILAEDYSQVDIREVNINDVGGDDITESFGMGLYFGGQSGNATINVDNVYMDGKVSPRNPEWTAWIGIVLENGSIQSSDRGLWRIDKNTNVNVTNSIFWNVETTFHVESVAGNVYWNTDNVKTRCKNYYIGAGINGELKERSYKLELEMLPYKRMGIINGMYYSEKERNKNISGQHEYSVHSSMINYLTIAGQGKVSPATSYGDSVRSQYHNTTLNNVPDVLVVNGSATFVNSQINLHSNNPETSTSLAQKWFSEPSVQFVSYQGSTAVNKSGSHKTATTGTKPAKMVNKGFVAPELLEPMVPPI